MTIARLTISAGACALALTVGACGGGAGGVASIPPTQTPTPTPTPAPATTPEGANTALNIIANAPTGEFALAGAVNSITPLAASEQPQMRYDAATNIYEVRFPGSAWETLWTLYDSDPDWSRGLGSGPEGRGEMWLNSDRKPGEADAYPYSSMGFYADTINGTNGYIAFGVPTPADAVPTSGSAQYDGMIDGTADIYVMSGGFESWPMPLSVSGTVRLSFDFSGGTLGGSMSPVLSSGESLGTVNFTNGVYSAGTYSGRFDASASGDNGFYGQLTGPSGEELIGGWALPFHYAGDDQDHQAIGAWVAKRP